MIRVGGHVSSAGGLAKAVARQQAIGGNCGQIFLSGPSAWKTVPPTPLAMAAFRDDTNAVGIAPWLAHAVYLINLASEDERIWQASIRSLQAYRAIGAAIGLRGVVFHTGTHRGAGLDAVLPRVVAALEAILAVQSGDPPLLLEVCAGQGGTIGAQFAELDTIIRAMGSPPELGVCLDTCHVFAAGYDVATPDGVARTLEEFEATIGLERLAAVHANDSVFPLGSHRDRHANIGEGTIGEAGFAALLAQPSLRALPWLLETPGVERSGPDERNVNLLRCLAGETIAGEQSGLATAPGDESPG